MTFLELQQKAKENIPSGTAKAFRLAILGNHATQFLKKALENAAQVANITLELYEADYDQIEREIIDPASRLYEFSPDAILISNAARKLRSRFHSLPVEEKRSFSSTFIDQLEDQLSILAARGTGKVIFCNLEELNDNVFGNYSAKVRQSFINQVRRINVALMDLAEQHENLYLLDLQSLHSRHGAEQAFASNIYINGDVAHSLDFTAAIALEVVGLVKNLQGKFKKCLILDLDNTMWGGVIGDDGLENIEIGSLGIGKAFHEFQKWIKELKNRGIILAVCSKNEEANAVEPFEKHPEMVLRMNDIAVFVANWNNKADNIRYIQEVLNIGFDSMVFLDDNPAEREIVRTNLPEVTVPEMPEDPAEYLEYLIGLNLFETTSFSSNDAGRTRQYQEEAKRKKQSQTFINVNDFLKSLEMKAEMAPFSSFDVPRIAQLSLRSNQFNLRTIRYTESDISRIMESDQHIAYSIKLEDKFGDYGLISILIGETRGETVFLDTWIMSCRVLKRGVEKYVLNRIVADLKAGGFKTLLGERIPTKKNILVKDHYKELGFNQEGPETWSLDLDTFQDFEVFIQSKN